MAALGAGKPGLVGSRPASFHPIALPRLARRTQPRPTVPHAVAGADAVLVLGNVLGMDAFLPVSSHIAQIAPLCGRQAAGLSGLTARSQVAALGH